MSDASKTDLRRLADEKLAQAAAIKKEAADQAAAENHKRLARAALRKQRIDELLAVAMAKAMEAGHMTANATNTGVDVKFGNEILRIELTDVGDDVVDFCGSMKVQRAQWDFYFRPDGAFVSMRFVPHAIIGRGLVGDQHPNGPAQFRNWTVDMARVASTIHPEVTGMTLDDVVHAGVAKLIVLAQLA